MIIPCQLKFFTFIKLICLCLPLLQTVLQHIRILRPEKLFSSDNFFIWSKLNSLEHFYRRQINPHQTHSAVSHIGPPQELHLSGNQHVFYNYFKAIVEAREQSVFSNTMAHECDIDWKRFPLVVGKPGTGKSFTIQYCIQFCIDNHLTTCVATPNWYFSLYL